MKRNICYIILFVCLCASLPAASKTSGRTAHSLHHISFWGGGGYSSMLNAYQDSRAVGGGGGLIGLGYEYRYEHFIFDVGAEYRMFSSLDKIHFPETFDVAVNADGLNLTKHYMFAEPMRENHVIGQAMVPLMIGGKWDRWYFLVGAKAGYTVLSTYKQRGCYSITLTDQDAYDPNWADMPVHGALTDVQYNAKGNIPYGLDVTASAEVGMNINAMLSRGWNTLNEGRLHPLHMRVALFADYGVLNLSQAPQGPVVSVDEYAVYSRSLHISNRVTGRLNSLLAGVKFTVLLQMNKPRSVVPKPALVLYIRDEQTDRGVPSATVALTQTDTPKPRTVRRVTNQKGVMSTKIAAGSYDLHLSHPDYFPADHSCEHGEQGDTLSFSLTHRPIVLPLPQDTLADTIEVVERRVNVLQRLFFAPNRTTILPESEQSLQELHSLLDDNPDMRIRIIGHTDSMGPDEVNQRLSEGRANSVRDDLIRRGISADRIEADGKGEHEPIAPNDTEEGRAQNRRVEFIVL